MRRQPPPPAIQTDLLSVLAEWSGRSVTEFPLDAPPCDAIGSAGEDAVLARVFLAVAEARPYYAASHPLSILASAIIVHQRRLATAWDAAKGSRPGPVADRRSWVELKPYEAMIAVLQLWLDALYGDTLGVAA